MDDTLLPAHLAPGARLQPRPRTESDLRHFEVIRAAAIGGLALSRPHRGADGALQGPSRLWPASAQVLARARIPEHAFSEADRLLARPRDAAADPHLARSRRCWRAWHTREFTAHDGVIPADDAVMGRALAKVLPMEALRRLLRDPQGFVWRDALGWRPNRREPKLLELDRASFGELVHETIRHAIDDLERGVGVSRASDSEIEGALEAARSAIATGWAVTRAIPPALLWRRTLDRAAAMAHAALDHDRRPGMQVWAEVSFGREAPVAACGPWDAREPVRLGRLRVGGRVDRLDLSADDRTALVTDYKTGRRPRNPARLVLGEGAELQRIIYGLAAVQRQPEASEVASRLVYLADGPPAEHGLDRDAIGRAGVEVARHAEAAVALLVAGRAPPGPDARDPYNEQRLALPADLDGYWRLKGAAVQSQAKPLADLWNRP